MPGRRSPPSTDVATGTTASVLATTGMGAWGVGEALGIDNL